MYTAHGHLDRDALIRQHAPLVRRIAQHMIAKLPPNVELDDLIQVGMIGLADALSRYESSQGVESTQKLLATVLVCRASTAKTPRGVVIQQVVLKRDA